MVQSVVIPTGALNAIPGISGVEDVRFDIPQLEDIVEEIDGTLPDADDIREEIEAALEEFEPVVEVTDDVIDSIVDPIVEEIEAQTGIDFPTVDVIAQAVADEIGPIGQGAVDIDIQGVFGPLADDVEEGFGRLLQDVPDQVDALLGGVSDVQDDVGEVLDRLDDLEVPEVPDIPEAISEALADAEPVVNDAGFFSDPVAFAVALIEEALDLVVSDATQERLQDRIQDAEEVYGGD